MSITPLNPVLSDLSAPPFRARTDRGRGTTTSPPGPKATWVGEVVVHGEDARRPLGIAHTYDPEALGVVADFYKGSNTLIGAKKRIAGLTLRATDQDWTHGSGPLVEGPMLPTGWLA